MLSEENPIQPHAGRKTVLMCVAVDVDESTMLFFYKSSATFSSVL
jgi:hypothetical protein